MIIWMKSRFYIYSLDTAYPFDSSYDRNLAFLLSFFCFGVLNMSV